MKETVNIASADLNRAREVLRLRMAGVSHEQIVDLVLRLIRRENELKSEVVQLRRDLGQVA